ncbi:hypothetical protein [Moraxella marmotae]|uniref:hypothetical protein n=1 Tax=Moraxella marmotae TaxID=3344520 RepID=UPI0035D431C6
MFFAGFVFHWLWIVLVILLYLLSRADDRGDDKLTLRQSVDDIHDGLRIVGDGIANTVSELDKQSDLLLARMAKEAEIYHTKPQHREYYQQSLDNPSYHIKADTLREILTGTVVIGLLVCNHNSQLFHELQFNCSRQLMTGIYEFYVKFKPTIDPSVICIECEYYGKVYTIHGWCFDRIQRLYVYVCQKTDIRIKHIDDENRAIRQLIQMYDKS